MQVEVAYAKPEVQTILSVDVADDATAEAAIRASGILARFPEIDLDRNKIGVFAKPCTLGHRLRPGDRVEIYRELVADPKESRRQRAARR